MTVLTFVISWLSVLAISSAHAADAEVGEPAPSFELRALDGATHDLASLRGKVVVLEWFNPDCPFVRYAHDEGGPLHTAAKDANAQGVVWLAVNSGAPGQQGHGIERNKRAAQEWNLEHPILVDASGAVGRSYGAKTTPHMYVIDDAGILVYQGALDDAPLGKKEGKPTRYVIDALTDLAASRAVSAKETKPYGCSVKYSR